MNIYKLISGKIREKLQSIPELHDFVNSEKWNNIVVEVPKNRDFGDFSTNVAMVLSRELRKNPREVADLLLPYIKDIPEITEVSVAGPGFINMNVSDAMWQSLVESIL